MSNKKFMTIADLNSRDDPIPQAWGDSGGTVGGGGGGGGNNGPQRMNMMNLLFGGGGAMNNSNEEDGEERPNMYGLRRKFNDTYWSYNLPPGQPMTITQYLCMNCCCPFFVGPPCSDARKRDYLTLLICSLSYITIIDVLYFIVEMCFTLFPFNFFPGMNFYQSHNAEVLLKLGGKHTYEIQHGQVFRLITPIFMHGSFLHIAMNLFVQLSLGMGYERNWYFFRMIPIYFLSGIFGNVLSSCIQPNNVGVGASGAIMGMLFAKVAYLICGFFQMNMTERCFHVMSVVTIVFMSFIISFAPNVDWSAHLGGAIMGFILGIAAFTNLIKFPKKYNIFNYIKWIIPVIALFIAFLLFVGMMLLMFLVVNADP